MAELAQEAQAIRDAVLFDEDGEQVSVELGPPVSAQRRGEVAAILGPLPPEVEALYDVCGWLEERFLDGEVRFDAAERDVAGVFSRCIRLGGDGFGNFWVVDVAVDGSWGPVFFACHDPPSFVVQAPDLATFLRQLREADFSASDPMRLVHDEASMRVWKDTEPGVPRQLALASTDAEVAAFARRQTTGVRIVDLRSRVIGSGWSGELPLLDREGLLFAVEDDSLPAPKPWWKRLFGG